MKLYDNNAYREEFMALVYDLLMSDETNDRANQIIDAFDRAPAVEAKPLAPKDPLTLEQLREMDGEPVWVVSLDGSRSERWAIIHVYGKGPEDLECYAPQYERLPGWAYGALGDHGWRAYRRKPGEGTT